MLLDTNCVESETMIAQRQFNECILRPSDIEPTRPELEVVSAFNPAAVENDGEVILVVRVAERPREERPGMTGLPRWDLDRGPVVDWVEDEQLDPVDPRMVRMKGNNNLRLTFISHLRIYRSSDPGSVNISSEQRFDPVDEYEVFGVEDPRITRIDDRFWMTYVVASENGPATALASTTDFVDFQRHGIAFCPENKDVVLFPERFDGDHVAIHRPNPHLHFSPPGMWLARSSNMERWGAHQVLHAGSSDWEAGRIGAGPPPIKTDEGWLLIYHGKAGSAEKGAVATYSAGLMLLDNDDPSKIVAHAEGPIMVPETEFETGGFVPSVVFPTATINRDNRLLVYYGAADTSTGLVEYSMDDLFNTLNL